MPFIEYSKWALYFKQKNEEMNNESKVPGRNILESPDSLVKGLVG